MTILVIGSDGQLGRELVRFGKETGLEMVGFDLPELDITDRRQVKKTLEKQGPEIVINAAAYTDVERAEDERKSAFSANSDAPAFLAEECDRTGAALIHISTDFVFGGDKKSPYLESDVARPLSVYGSSKLEGEKRIMERLRRYLIFRTSWLYGVYGNNFVKTMLKFAGEKESVNVVSDQRGSPTCAADLAEALLFVSGRVVGGAKIEWGIYHFCGLGITTWEIFAKQAYEIAKNLKILSKTPEVLPVSTGEFPAKAKRPLFSALDCAKIKKNFGITPPPWKEGLKKTLERIRNEKKI